MIIAGSSCGPLVHPNIFGSTKKNAKQQKFDVLKVATYHGPNTSKKPATSSRILILQVSPYTTRLHSTTSQKTPTGS
jgi:hypothetical protein